MTVIFLDREDQKQTEEEEANIFIRDILENIGIPDLDEIWPEPILTVQNKIELRKLLSKFNINIVDAGNKTFKIYVDKELIGEWNTPKYRLLQDLSQVDPKKKLYLEMTTDCWSVFDEGEKEE